LPPYVIVTDTIWRGAARSSSPLSAMTPCLTVMK
jgi:hypothetical protein